MKEKKMSVRLYAHGSEGVLHCLSNSKLGTSLYTNFFIFVFVIFWHSISMKRN